MAAAAPIAAISSLASIGLSAYSSVEQGAGQKAANDFQAAQAEKSAKIGRLNADLTDVSMRERQNMLIGNIDAIRATGNIDPSSPTGGAVEDYNRMLSTRQRTAAELSAREQADSEDASAAYLRQAGSYAQQMSYLGAGSTIFSGFAKGFGKGGGFNLG